MSGGKIQKIGINKIQKMKIKGSKIKIEKTAEVIFTFFTYLDNFKKIMPDNVQKFEVSNDKDSFLFSLPGMPEIELALTDKTKFSHIALTSASSKFSFTLSMNIKEISENNSEVQLYFEGNFNAMMSMMIKRPITKFIDTLTEKIEQL